MKIDEVFFAEICRGPAGVGAAGREDVYLLVHGVLLARFELENFNDLENGVGVEGVFAVRAEKIRTEM